MKRILSAALAAFFSTSLFAATLNPIQLLNPAGSTSGQAIVSTGATTAPAWASVSAAALTGLLPVAQGGTGATTVTGSGANVLGTSPTITTPNIVGVATNSNAAAGSVGEYPTPTNLTGVTLPTTTVTNASSVPLTAGDYDVSCSITFAPPGGVGFTNLIASISTTSGGTASGTGTRTSLILPFTVSQSQEIFTPVVRESLASTTTVYCTGYAVYSSGSATLSGVMRVRRIR